jgi:hypothetical protein
VEAAQEGPEAGNRTIRFVAAVCDFYVLACIGGFVAAFVSAIAGQTLSAAIAASMILVFIAVTAAYHLKFWRMSDFRSVGDRIIGRSYQGGSAQYSNPFGINRWAMFLVIVVTLMMASNAWDRNFDGPPWTIGEAIGTGLRCAAIILGATMLASGKVWGSLFPIAIYGLGAIAVYRQGIDNEIQAAAFYLFAGLAVLNLLVAVYYGLLGNGIDKASSRTSADA